MVVLAFNRCEYLWLDLLPPRFSLFLVVSLGLALALWFGFSPLVSSTEICELSL